MSGSRKGGRAVRVCARWALALAAVWAVPSFAADAGTPDSQPAPEQDAPLGDEDREVVQDLELLENLDASQDLDLLLELSKKDENAPKP